MTKASHDPRLDDPRLDDMRHTPLPVREVYAWRLAVQDEKQGMTQGQIKAYYEASRKETDAICDGLGIKIKYAKSAVTA